jgi:hypothetical protein
VPPLWERVVKNPTVQTVCECQAKLGAELDAAGHVLRGWARSRRTGKAVVAPAHSIGAGAPRFQIGWACPFCTRNLVRLFDAGGLAFRDPSRAA